jgi:glycosyltransferase involved in cell wall biosynthesis
MLSWSVLVIKHQAPATNTVNKHNITFFFPVYNDAATIRTVADKAKTFLEDCANEYEIIIIDDGSPDDSGKIADQLAAECPRIKVIHHSVNRGYGAALQTGFAAAAHEIICFTDGDDEYDVYDFYKLIKLVDYYDLIITFRYRRMYSHLRIVVSKVYNILLRWLFSIAYRDISTGLRLVRKSVVDDVVLESNSPFIGAELTVKVMLKGYRVGEVGIQTFPREFNKGSAVTIKNILLTIKDIYKIYRTIFSKNYDIASNRTPR